MALILRMNVDDKGTKAIQNLGKAVDETGQKVEKVGVKMQDVASAALIIKGLQLVASQVSAIVHEYAEWENAIRSIEAIAGVTGESLKEFESVTRSLSTETEHSASNIAKAALEISKMGFDPKGTIEALPSILNLATVGMTDLQTASMDTITVLKSFNMDETGANVQRVSDVISTALNETSLDFLNFMDAMKFVGPIANQMNVSLEETSALLGMLADVGLRGSLGGTTLKNILLNFMMPSENVKKALDDLGLAGKNTGELLAGLREKGISVLDFLATFDKRAVTGAVALSTLSQEVKELEERLKNSSGATERMAEIIRGSLLNQALNLRNQLGEVGISLLDAFAPELKAAMSGIGESLKDLVFYVDQHKEEIKELGASFITVSSTALKLAGAISVGLLGAFSSLAPVLKDTKSMAIALFLVMERKFAMGLLNSIPLLNRELSSFSTVAKVATIESKAFGTVQMANVPKLTAAKAAVTAMNTQTELSKVSIKTLKASHEAYAGVAPKVVTANKAIGTSFLTLQNSIGLASIAYVGIMALIDRYEAKWEKKTAHIIDTQGTEDDLKKLKEIQDAMEAVKSTKATVSAQIDPASIKSAADAQRMLKEIQDNVSQGAETQAQARERLKNLTDSYLSSMGDKGKYMAGIVRDSESLKGYISNMEKAIAVRKKLAESKSESETERAALDAELEAAKKKLGDMLASIYGQSDTEASASAENWKKEIHSVVAFHEDEFGNLHAIIKEYEREVNKVTGAIRAEVHIDTVVKDISNLQDFMFKEMEKMKIVIPVTATFNDLEDQFNDLEDQFKEFKDRIDRETLNQSVTIPIDVQFESSMMNIDTSGLEKIEEELQEARAELEALISGDRQGKRDPKEQVGESLKDDYTSTIMSMVSDTQDLFETLGDIRNNVLQNEYDQRMDDLDNWYTTEVAMAEEGSFRKIAADQKYAQAKEQLEKEQEARAKEMARRQQHLSAAKAAMNTAEGVTAALTDTSLPTALRIGQAFAVGALGAAEVVQIYSQKFREGGDVDGPGNATSDSVPARLSKGEKVISSRDVKRAGGSQVIQAFIDRGGSQTPQGVTVRIDNFIGTNEYAKELVPYITRELQRW